MKDVGMPHFANDNRIDTVALKSARLPYSSTDRILVRIGNDIRDTAIPTPWNRV
jgi:hypothetical protein